MSCLNCSTQPPDPNKIWFMVVPDTLRLICRIKYGLSNVDIHIHIIHVCIYHICLLYLIYVYYIYFIYSTKMGPWAHDPRHPCATRMMHAQPLDPRSYDLWRKISRVAYVWVSSLSLCCISPLVPLSGLDSSYFHCPAYLCGLVASLLVVATCIWNRSLYA